MGDNAEFEKLSMLEARLAAALDRIAGGIGQMRAAPPIEDPGITSSAFEDAVIRAEAAEARAAELEARLAALDAAAAPREESADTAEIERLTAQVAELEGRVTRLRAERAEAIAERDEARDIAEELQAAGGMGPDDRNMALRAEVQELRTINERLTKNLNRLRGENASDPSVLNKALVVELDALKAARASEAAELERILADMDRAGAGEGGHA
jgi:predicted RNase H-like nuclease (RuvC/YqgF family)